MYTYASLHTGLVKTLVVETCMSNWCRESRNCQGASSARNWEDKNASGVGRDGEWIKRCSKLLVIEGCNTHQSAVVELGLLLLILLTTIRELGTCPQSNGVKMPRESFSRLKSQSTRRLTYKSSKLQAFDHSFFPHVGTENSR